MSNLYMLSSNKLALKPFKVALIWSKVIYMSVLFRQQSTTVSQEDHLPDHCKICTTLLNVNVYAGGDT